MHSKIFLLSRHLWNTYYVPKIALSTRHKKMSCIFLLPSSHAETGFLEAMVNWTKERKKPFKHRTTANAKEKLLYKLFNCNYFEFLKGDMKLVVSLEILSRAV